jgi:hypothetical protein
VDGVPQSNLQHDTSQNPRQSPTATTVTVNVRPSIYQHWVASLWPLATIEGAETNYILMSMTWYEYEVNEVSHNDTSQNPRQSPTAAIVTVRPRISGGVASSWPVAKVAGAKSLHICIKSTSYEYELYRGPQSWPTAYCKWETKWMSYCHHWDCETKHISVWCCILMTSSQSGIC